MAKALSTLAVGTKIKDTATTYNGKPIIWVIADKNHAGYPSGSVTLITERIISLKCFDAMEPTNSDGNRKSYGNNRYIYANLRKWLNSTAAAGKWYSAAHGQDQAPTNSYVWSNYNEYDQEAGFMSGFSTNFRANIMATTLTVARNTVTDGGGSETCSDNVFMASTTEVGLANENGIAEGSKLALFSSDASRQAYPTAEAVSKSEYTSSNLSASQYWYWWLRTCYASYSCGVRYVASSGALHSNDAFNGDGGVRPLCNLKSGLLVSDSPDSDGAYTIRYNSAPTVPSSITVPAQIIGGSNTTITWGASTDPDVGISGYDLAGYILERSVAGGAWSQVYKGSNRTFTDTITFGWASVAYRVKAYDGQNTQSAYKTSDTRTIINNYAPTISGADGSLGEKTGAFNFTYSVNDQNTGDTLAVKEHLDGVQRKSFNATHGATNTVQISASDFLKLTNGTHTYKITVTDPYGAEATRTHTFTKNITEIMFSLTSPLPADAMPTKGILTVTRQLPTGAIFKVEACNNGNDTSPAWEDVTSAVVGQNKFFFKNTAKTAAAWGFNFRITVQRNGATGDCFVQAVGGNFE